MNIAVIGGGPAGLAAAMAACQAGAKATVYDRLDHPGGILNQCIHSGFGLRVYGEEWTGPEFAEQLLKDALEAGVKIHSGCEVVSLSKDRQVVIRDDSGIETLQADAIVLANGCWERNRGPILLAGTRPSGIFSAGEAQQWVNLHGYLPGRKALILGSGDIGLIMARRLFYEGTEVVGVAEIAPFVSGNTRNQIQCLEETGIPLWLGETAIQVHGQNRLEGVTLARFQDGQPIAGTERFVECDTLLLSVGLVPENELTHSLGMEMDPVTGGAVVDQGRATSLPGFYACGNCLHVHDLVDNVVMEAKIAGRMAALGHRRNPEKCLHLKGNLRYVMPQTLDPNLQEPLEFYLRVKTPEEGLFTLSADGEILVKRERLFRPGEMLEVKLTPAQTQRVLNAQEVVFSCGA